MKSSAPDARKHRPTKRAYLTGEARREIENRLIAIAADEGPVTIRHLFYRAATEFPERIPKDDCGARKVNAIVNALRWEERIAWQHVRDSSRSPRFAGGYRDVGEFLTTHANHYRVNAWEHLPDSVTVWCESESAMGMIDQLCARKGVDLYPCRGQPSNDFLWRAIGYISGDVKADEDGRALLLYVGDLDKEGREIPLVIERKLRESFGGYVDFDFELRRLAINEDQVEEFNLPLKPGKHDDLTCELEAMPGPVLRRILSDAIDEHMPSQTLATLRTVEAEEKRGLVTLSNALRGEKVTIGDLAKYAQGEIGTSTNLAGPAP